MAAELSISTLEMAVQTSLTPLNFSAHSLEQTLGLRASEVLMISTKGEEEEREPRGLEVDTRLITSSGNHLHK